MPFRRLMVTIADWFAPSRDLDAPIAEAVLTKHAGSLMRMKGVMSVGIGRTDDGRPAIFVGVDNPQAASVSDIPESLEGVPIVHREVGRPEAREPRPDIERAERSARAIARREFHALDLGETPLDDALEEPSDDPLP